MTGACVPKCGLAPCTTETVGHNGFCDAGTCQVSAAGDQCIWPRDATALPDQPPTPHPRSPQPTGCNNATGPVRCDPDCEFCAFNGGCYADSDDLECRTQLGYCSQGRCQVSAAAAVA